MGARASHASLPLVCPGRRREPVGHALCGGLVRRDGAPAHELSARRGRGAGHRLERAQGVVRRGLGVVRGVCQPEWADEPLNVGDWPARDCGEGGLHRGRVGERSRLSAADDIVERLQRRRRRCGVPEARELHEEQGRQQGASGMLACPVVTGSCDGSTPPRTRWRWWLIGVEIFAG